MYLTRSSSYDLHIKVKQSLADRRARVLVKQRGFHDNLAPQVASSDSNKRRSLKRSSSDTSTLKRKRNSLKNGNKAYNGLFTDDTSVWTSKLDNCSFAFLLYENFMKYMIIFFFLSTFKLMIFNISYDHFYYNVNNLV